MSFLKTILAVTSMITMAQADTIKITAQSDNTFSPGSVKAKQGDILEFHFQSQNHSIVAGDYKYPCSPLPVGSGFFSGFVDAEKGEADKVFRVTVANTDPVPFYSSQGDECPKGMVGIINPSDKETLDDYKKRASGLARGVTPGKSSYGGEMADNKSAAPTGGKGDGKNDGKDSKDGKSAASAERAPMMALVAAFGVLAYAA